LRTAGTARGTMRVIPDRAPSARGNRTPATELERADGPKHAPARPVPDAVGLEKGRYVASGVLCAESRPGLHRGTGLDHFQSGCSSTSTSSRPASDIIWRNLVRDGSPHCHANGWSGRFQIPSLPAHG
jgi:hypothetical protein